MKGQRKGTKGLSLLKHMASNYFKISLEKVKQGNNKLCLLDMPKTNDAL